MNMDKTNFKSLLQHHCQRARQKLPKYSCTERRKGISPVYVANLSVLGRNFTSEAEFSTKKKAEQSAAKVALLELGILDAEKKLNLSGSPAPMHASYGAYSGREVGQSCGEESPVIKVAAEESPLKGASPASTSSAKDSNQDAQISSPEVQRALSPPNDQSSVPAPVSFKSVLSERAQKMGLALPQYETTREGSGFVCIVTFNGQSFKSEGSLHTKKLAQQNAASVVVNALNLEQETCEESVKVSYKNLLQENCHQRGYKLPVYSTTSEGIGFISTVSFGDKVVSSKTTYKSKKQAEHMVAREALLFIGVSNPEEVYSNKATKKNKLKRKFAPKAGYQKTSWVHFRGVQGQESSEWGDVDYFWEQAISRKRKKLDPGESPANRSGQFGAGTFVLPLDHRRDLTVGEIWKEKKNVVIVGDAESSFILYCTRIPGTCNIFNTRTMSLVMLEPGYRLVGLDAQYCDNNGKVALQAERCADVIVPKTPDPVLTSCGVVLLFQDPQSSSLQVLLKRYLSSQAFINVVAALAQYFRRRVAGRPVWLDIQSLTEHIREWMWEEVQNIATMNKEALQHVFSYMWKFNKRWCSVLNPPLPKDLEVLKARAADELARRQASDVHHSEDFYHPWSLPKGNFKHRILSTGLFIEPAADCAVRELKEETGIKLEPDEIKDCPQIDLLQNDNLNPHKGDMVKYFLYVYSPDSVEDDLNSSQEGDTSLDGEMENSIDEVEDFFPKFPPLDLSAELETLEKGQDEKNCKVRPDDCVCSEREEDRQENSLNKVESHSTTDTSEADQEIITEPLASSTIDQASQERRGVKRKRDDGDKEMNSARLPNLQEVSASLTKQASTPNKSNKSLDSVSFTTPGSKQDVIMARSPHVQGSVHEECAWFTVEEARLKSPVFEQIYHTEQFTKFLNFILPSEEW